MAQLQIKVIPGASRDRIVGRLGEAWKVQVSAAPERGRANEAVLRVLADALNVRVDQVQIVRGHAQPRKIVRIIGIEQHQLDARLAELA